MSHLCERELELLQFDSTDSLCVTHPPSVVQRAVEHVTEETPVEHIQAIYDSVQEVLERASEMEYIQTISVQAVCENAREVHLPFC